MLFRNYSNRKAFLEVLNPKDKTTIATLPIDDDNNVKEAFDIAKTKGIKHIENMSIESRKASMTKFMMLLEDNENELSKTLTNEMGKPLQQV